MSKFVESIIKSIKADEFFRLVSYREFKPSQKPDPEAVGVVHLETEHTESTTWELWIQLREDFLCYWISDTKWTPFSNLPWCEIRKCEDFEQAREDFLQVRYVEPDPNISDDELTLLINAASESVRTVQGYDEMTRAWLYTLAVVTGYRRKELGTITADSFDFTSDPPTLTVLIGQTKNKEEAVQLLRPELVPGLKEFLADRDGLILPKLASLKTHLMMDNDLEEACLPKQVKEGKRVFHSLRHTFCSTLGSSGLPITEVRDGARHGDIRTTNGYMHSNRGAAKRAVEALPKPRIPGQGGRTS